TSSGSAGSAKNGSSVGKFDRVWQRRGRMTDPPKPLHPWRWNSGAQLNLRTYTSTTAILAGASVPNQGWKLDSWMVQGSTSLRSFGPNRAEPNRFSGGDAVDKAVACSAVDIAGAGSAMPNFDANALKSSA